MIGIPASSRSAAAAALAPVVPAARARSEADVRRHIRGSSLMLVGRFISVILNFVAQVLIVRYLSKEEYGDFAYGIGVATIGTSVVLAGLSKTIARLVPIYHEEKNDARAFGHIALAFLTVSALAATLIAGLYTFQQPIARAAHIGPQAVGLLLILIALAPLDAFDNLLQQLVAVFGSSRAIFVRRQVLGPALKVVAALLVVASGGSVYLLACGYVAGPVIGVSLYIALLVAKWKKAGLLRHLRPDRLVLPARELYGFSVPLLSSELSIVLRGSIAVILLQYFHTTSGVAEYRAVLPVAGLNMLVFEAFAFLFVPFASRMFARRDHEGICDLYWQTSLWIAVLTFPMFLLTCSLAGPLTVRLFGERYHDAAILMSILSAGYYFNAALGFNSATLRVHGKLRTIVFNDILGAALCVAVSVIAIRRYGTIGAAVATTGMFVVQNVMNNIGLWAGDTGIRLIEWRFARVYGLLMLAAVAVFAAQWLLRPPAAVSLVLAAVVSVWMIRVTRKTLRPEVTFPELLRMPVLRRILS